MRTASMFHTLSLATLALIGTAAVVRAAGPAEAVTAAVADPSRPAEDTQRDANRKPAQTLSFADVKPGEKVAELLPGGGYFTRLLSKTVGAGGHVYGVVPAPLPNAPPDMPDFAARMKAIAAEPGYANVSVVVQPFSELKLPEPVDLVWISQNYHDLHNFPGIDVAMFDKRVFDALKPGGIFYVVDHAAAAGSGSRDASTLHRIDPATVKQEVTAAGFEFVGGSDVLKNAADPHTVKVFDSSVRGKTDQFILKFRKPKQ